MIRLTWKAQYNSLCLLEPKPSRVIVDHDTRLPTSFAVTLYRSMLVFAQRLLAAQCRQRCRPQAAKGRKCCRVYLQQISPLFDAWQVLTAMAFAFMQFMQCVPQVESTAYLNCARQSKTESTVIALYFVFLCSLAATAADCLAGFGEKL